MNKHVTLFASSLHFAVKNFFKQPWFWWKVYIWTIFFVTLGFVVPALFFAALTYLFKDGWSWLLARSVPSVLIKIIAAVLMVAIVASLVRAAYQMVRMVTQWFVVILDVAQGVSVQKKSMHELPNVSNKTLLHVLGYGLLYTALYLSFVFIFNFCLNLILLHFKISYELKSMIQCVYFIADPFEPLWFANIAILLVITWLFSRISYGIFFLIDGTSSVFSAFKKSIALTKNQFGITALFAVQWYGFPFCIQLVSQLIEGRLVLQVLFFVLSAWMVWAIGHLMIARSYVLMQK